MANLKKKNKSSRVEEIARAKGTRDMFGRLLFLKVFQRFSKVFSCPLLPDPPCFANPDGSLRQSPKSKVIHFLKNGLRTTPPEQVRVFIADGMFLVHIYIANCSTYGDLVRKLISSLMNSTTERVDLCFDVFESLGIKDIEHKERGYSESLRLFSIGPVIKN